MNVDKKFYVGSLNEFYLDELQPAEHIRLSWSVSWYHASLLEENIWLVKFEICTKIQAQLFLATEMAGKNNVSTVNEYF